MAQVMFLNGRAPGPQRNRRRARHHFHGDGRDESRHTPAGLGVKPCTSPNFLLSLLPYPMRLCLHLYYTRPVLPKH